MGPDHHRHGVEAIILISRKEKTNNHTPTNTAAHVSAHREKKHKKYGRKGPSQAVIRE